MEDPCGAAVSNLQATLQAEGDGCEESPATTTTTTGSGKAVPAAAAQCSVTSTYMVRIADAYRRVTVVWSECLLNHTLDISVENPGGGGGGVGSSFACRIENKLWPFWGKKGLKSFELDGRHAVDIFWDLRSVKFSNGGPEPTGGFYVALVHGGEVVLLLGDCKKEAFKRTKSRPSLEDPVMVCKKEVVVGSKKPCYSARARFVERRGGREHHIVVDISGAGAGTTSRDAAPEMWIRIDGAVSVHVSNLQWKFRGNEAVVVDEVPVQVLWDVHDWLFGAAGHALFIFKPGAAAPATEAAAERQAVMLPEFCFFLYAWRTE